MSLIRSEFPEQHGFTLEVEFENAQVSAESIDDLASIDRLPDVVEDLSMRIWHPKVYANVRQIDREVHFSIDRLGGHLTVHGANETWVVGLRERLQRIFDEDRPFRDNIIPWLRSTITQSVVIGMSIIAIFAVYQEIGLAYSLFFSIAMSYLLLRYVNWSIWAFTGRYQVELRESKSMLFGMAPKEYLPIVIALVTAIITGANFILSLLR